MSMCKTCLKDSTKHNKKLWIIHNWCALCQKNSKEHSDKLWQMHQQAVLKGAKGQVWEKEKKLWPITVGLSRASVGVAVELNAKPPYDIDIIPVYMHCVQCSMAMGDVEVDNADILDGLCLKCFREMTEQTDSWYDIPNYMSYEYCQKIRKRMEMR